MSHPGHYMGKNGKEKAPRGVGTRTKPLTPSLNGHRQPFGSQLGQLREARSLDIKPSKAAQFLKGAKYVARGARSFSPWGVVDLMLNIPSSERQRPRQRPTPYTGSARYLRGGGKR